MVFDCGAKATADGVTVTVMPWTKPLCVTVVLYRYLIKNVTLDVPRALLPPSRGLDGDAKRWGQPGHKLEDNFYVRSDGTRTYYFDLGTLTVVMRVSS